jgi:hypothetical protein
VRQLLHAHQREKIRQTRPAFFPIAKALTSEKSTGSRAQPTDALHPAIPEAPTVFKAHDKSLVFSIEIVFANTRNTRINGKNGNNKGVFAAMKIEAQKCSPGLWPGSVA